MKRTELDQIDRQILDLLIENARVPLIEIAERVGLSRVAVKNRIDALEKSGVIEQYTVVLDPEKIGRNVSVFFDIPPVSTRWLTPWPPRRRSPTCTS